MAQRAAQVVVSGRVQGVGFRWSALDQAQRLGVSGWVRNLNNGSVQAWVEGSNLAVAQMIDWLGIGPAWAHVESCEVHEEPPLGITGFRVR